MGFSKNPLTKPGDLWVNGNWGKSYSLLSALGSVIFGIANTELYIHYATFMGVR